MLMYMVKNRSDNMLVKKDNEAFKAIMCAICVISLSFRRPFPFLSSLIEFYWLPHSWHVSLFHTHLFA